MRGGDREAEFREYLLADRTRLMRTALLLTAGDVHTAEDLVQTACTRVYVHWHRIKHEGAGPYAHRILVNAFLDERRRAGRHPEVVTAETLEPRLSDEVDPADTLAVRGRCWISRHGSGLSSYCATSRISMWLPARGSWTAPREL